MESNTNKYIRANYRLYVLTDEREELVEETTSDRPFAFISGLGVLLQAFEDQLTPLSAGDSFDFALTPTQAYGEHQDERVLKLDREMFTIDGQFDARRIRKGAMVPLVNEDGQRFNGLVLDVDDTHVTVDLNHPLAGRTLRFRGEVLESRDATNEELARFAETLAGEDDDEDCGCKGDGSCKRQGGGQGGHCCHHRHNGDGHCRHHEG